MKIPMSLPLRRELLLRIKENYPFAPWKYKIKLLDGFITATGYQRKYAISLLHRKNTLVVDGDRIQQQ